MVVVACELTKLTYENQYLMTVDKDTVPRLDKRSRHFLKILIESYLSEGQPVGSRALSRDSDLSLSPATVRNVMADLEERGFIRSPHTSSGRVPTIQGYRFFVDSLLAVKPPDEIEINNLRDELLLPDFGSKALIEKASFMLTGVTSLASIVSIPKPDKSGLKHIEFIPLNQRRVLVVMVIGNDEVQNRIIHVDREFTQSDFTEFANYLNSRLDGQQEFPTIRDEIIREMKAAREHVNSMMINAIRMAEQAMQDDTPGDYVLAGETKLMDFADAVNLDKLKHLFEAFHQKQEILKLLDRCAEADGIQIFIGNESGYDVLEEWSVVTAPYSIDGNHVGVLGVIGPTRMAYDRIIPIVDITARLLGLALKAD